MAAVSNYLRDKYALRSAVPPAPAQPTPLNNVRFPALLPTSGSPFYW